jgi:Ca2+-binding RTX toxin-like protein
MLSSLFRRLFVPIVSPPTRLNPLGLDVFEDRVVPASVTFTNGVLFVSADSATNDFVHITAAGSKHDGSTGVKLFTNVTGTWTTQTFGDAAHPVTNIALDMKDGNDFVDVDSLRATTVFIGEGNGNNIVHLGDTLSGGLITGSGRNFVEIDGGSVNVFGDSSLPGVAAGSAVFLGWGYQFTNGGTGIFTTAGVGNNNNNVIDMDTTTSETALVDVNGNGNNVLFGGRGTDAFFVQGNGNNRIFGGPGNDRIIINGSGNNQVHAGTGTDTVNISGSGNNSVWSSGSGAITIDGGGKNAVHGRRSSNLTVSLNGAGAGSSIVGTLTDGIFVDGTQVTASGTQGNVTVKIVTGCSHAW